MIHAAKKSPKGRTPPLHIKGWIILLMVVLIVGWMIGTSISDDCMRIRGLM